MDDSGWYTNFGPQERELRRRFAAFLGVEETQVATASSATMCLQGAATISPAAHWRLPAFTFPATPAALLQAGGSIEFLDIRPEDWWIDHEGSCAGGDVGLVPVAPLGAPLDIERWDPTGEVIIDAAASIGTDLPPLDRLPATWAIVFSLHATKCLPAGEGGLVVFGDGDRAERFRAWTNFGLDATRRSLLPATNAKLSEVAAVYAHASLDAWERTREQWQRSRAIADELEREHGLDAQPGPRPGISPYWILVLPDSSTRLEFERILAEHGVETRRWWSDGCHRMPAFADHPRAPLPVTDSVAARALGLPMFIGMDAGHGARISCGLAAARHLWSRG